MKNIRIITFLAICISILAVIASSSGIFSNSGPGSYEYQSIRGKSVTIYGKGMYHDMSADVAIQGIGQDYVTLFLAVPILLVALTMARKGSVKSRLFLAGFLNYFLVTYMMHLEIAMYNALFLVYVMLVSASFFCLALVLMSFEISTLPEAFSEKTPVKFAGGFLIGSSIMIGLLWLSVVVPPLLDGSVVPDAVEHYTTLTVQGLDLAIFLPVAFISGWLLIKRRPFGYLMGPVTLVFLPVLMTALVAKLIAMALAGVNVIPAIFIIPAVLMFSAVACSRVFMCIRNS